MVDSSNIKEYLPHIVVGSLAVITSAALVYKLRQSTTSDPLTAPADSTENLLSQKPTDTTDSTPAQSDTPKQKVLKLDLVYGEDLTVETYKLQEKDKSQFKIFRQLSKDLEKLCTPGRQEDIQKFEQMLMDSEYKYLTSYALYRCLRKSLSMLNVPWVKFFLERVGLDLSQSIFRYMVHQFIADRGQKGQAAYLQGEQYSSDVENELLQILLATRFKDMILKEKDEGRGNTVLHIACEMHSFGLTKILIEAGADKSATNDKEESPLDMVNDALSDFGSRVGPQKDRALERLMAIKNLF